MKTIQGLAALALAAVTSTVLAAAPAFEKVDANSDGAISSEEAQVVNGLDFGAADLNADGKLNAEEYQTATKDM